MFAINPASFASFSTISQAFLQFQGPATPHEQRDQWVGSTSVMITFSISLKAVSKYPIFVALVKNFYAKNNPEESN